MNPESPTAGTVVPGRSAAGPARASVDVPMSRTAAILLVCWFGVLLAVGERLVFSTGLGGGSGLLALGTTVSALIGIALLAVSPTARLDLGRLFVRALPVMAFFTLGLIVPLIGVIIGFPPRTVVGVLTPIASVAFLLVGVRLAPLSRWSVLVGWAMTGAVVVNAAAGVLQALYHRGVVLPLASSLVAWDASITQAYGIPLITGRASGLYANPNTYCLLGAMGLLFAAFGGRGAYRVPLALGSLAVLLLGQSRSALLGVTIALLMGAVTHRVRTGRRFSRPVVIGSVVVALVSIAALLAAVRLSPTFGSLLAARLAGLLTLVGGGTRELDPNLAARVGFWKAAWDAVLQAPLGVFGPPNTVLSSSIDNDYLRLLVQGGVLYAASYVLMLAWLAVVSARTLKPTLMLALPVLVAITSLTQTNSTMVPFVSAFCLIAGASLLPLLAAEDGRT